MEKLLKEAIEFAIRSGDDPNTRIKAVLNNASYKLLDKPWKPIAFSILRKEEPVNPEEEVKVKATRRRGGRRRGVKGSSGIEDSLLSPSQAISSNESAAFKLANLLIHKGRNPKNWHSDFDVEIDGLRNECISGIHPVWSIAGRECPLIAQLGAFPSLEEEAQNTDIDSTWVEQSRIDPTDLSSLGNWLQTSSNLNLGSSGILAIQILAKGISKMRINQIRIPAELLTSELSEHMMIGGYLLIASGKSEKGLELLQSINSENDVLMQSVGDVIALTSLRLGDTEKWDHCANCTGSDPLSMVMRTEAWKSPPLNHSIGADRIESGIMHLELQGEPVSDTLRWMLVKQVAESGNLSLATELVLETKIDNDTSFIQASALAGENELLISRLIETADTCSLITWSEIVMDPIHPKPIQFECAKLIANERCPIPKDVLEPVIEILSIEVDIYSLALILSNSMIKGTTNPYSVLLCSALAPADIGQEAIDWLQTERPQAHDSIESNDPPQFLSAHEATLIRLLDGARSNLDEILGRLPETGSEVLREARRALMEDGDGLVSEKRINVLDESIIEANLSTLEAALFQAIVNLLRMNRVNNEIQMSDKERKSHASELLNGIIENSFSAIFLDQVQSLLLEHEVTSPAFVTWLQENRPGSEWAPVANAAINVGLNRHLEAARLYKQAAPRFQAPPHRDFEIATQLYRKSLIGFAQATRWSEAVDLLESHAELATTITSRFKLYLQVSHSFEQQQDRRSRRSSNRDIPRKMIHEFTDKKIPFVPRDEEDSDNSKRRERNRRKEDLIESLMSYPSKRNLPEEPFVGRVRAALNHVRDQNKSSRTRVENRFREAIKDQEDQLELLRIANEVAGEDPVRALGMLEHAVSACTYFGRMDKARLIAAMTALYRKHENNIPIKFRRVFNSVNLAPLVVIDTNLLLDALVAEILRKMAMERNALINPNSSLRFHHILRHARSDNGIHTFIPSTARNEFRSKITRNDTGKFDPSRALSLFSNNNHHINLDAYNEAITPEVLEKMYTQILTSFHDWEPSNASEFLKEVEDQQVAVESFIQSHSEIYQRVTNFKAQRGAADKRSVYAGESIYPEKGDLDIMRTATYLAASSYPSIGSVIVATRDSDFTLLARALEETLGVGVAKNASELAQWL